MAAKLARADVRVEETWRLDDIFPAPLAWEEALSGLMVEYDGLEHYLGHLGEGAPALLACLDAEE
ncbi:MAG TPA: oligoendopeptidase F, partial [Symbiobacteriaceae bacterium]|nr:oligoendopeptidase F [Symbiobacteriaceae bacterium]